MKHKKLLWKHVRYRREMYLCENNEVKGHKPTLCYWPKSRSNNNKEHKFWITKQIYTPLLVFVGNVIDNQHHNQHNNTHRGLQALQQWQHQVYRRQYEDDLRFRILSENTINSGIVFDEKSYQSLPLTKTLLFNNSRFRGLHYYLVRSVSQCTLTYSYNVIWPL